MAEEIDLETLYSPSRWSKRLSPDVICEKHVEITKKASEKTKATIPHQLDIPYGERPKEKFDIFGTDLDSDAPLLIFIHGGYWQEQAILRDLFWFLSDQLYKNKIKTILLGYELCPDVTILELMQDIKTGLKKCFEYASKCGSRTIYLAGHSAGAHLVASMFMDFIKEVPEETRSKIKAAFLLCGIYDLTPLVKIPGINGPLKLDEALAKQLSPQHQELMAYESNIYVVAAEDDSPAFVEQSVRFYEKLKKSGVKTELKVVKNVDHFNFIELLADGDFEVTKFIVNKIKQ